MSNIIKYLPKILQDVEEFKIINFNLDTELGLLDLKISNILKEVIVQTATIYGLEKWEATLGIVPGGADSFDFRKFKVLNILTSKLPYTIRWLNSKLIEILGTTGFSVTLANNDYALTIQLSGLDPLKMTEVEKNLRNAIPANMVLLITSPPVSEQRMYIGTSMRTAIKYQLKSGY